MDKPQSTVVPNSDSIAASYAGKHWALAISVVLHPTLLACYAFAGLMLGQWLPIGLAPDFRLALLGVLSVVAFVLPATLVWLGYFLGLVTDLQLRSKADRLYALWATAAIYAGAAWALQVALPLYLWRLLIGLAALAALNAGINFVYRISGHACAAAAFSGYFITMAWASADLAWLPPIVGAILATGLASWARLTLGAHQTNQVVWGAVLGSVAGVSVGLWSL